MGMEVWLRLLGVGALALAGTWVCWMGLCWLVWAFGVVRKRHSDPFKLRLPHPLLIAFGMPMGMLVILLIAEAIGFDVF